jgi:hypothetical protein
VLDELVKAGSVVYVFVQVLSEVHGWYRMRSSRTEDGRVWIVIWTGYNFWAQARFRRGRGLRRALGPLMERSRTRHGGDL